MAAQPLKRRDVSPEEWDTWRWSGEEPEFHRKSYSEVLRKYYGRLFKDGATGRFFVPLCGKTLDMLFLAEQGHEVVGLEFSKAAIEAFFNDNNLAYTEEKMSNAPFIEYKVKERNITIYQGDLFTLDPGICGEFDASWDRGSYVAINVSTQQKYADLMSKLLKPGAKILMEAVALESSKYAGPPHDISVENLEKTFGRFDVEFLEYIARIPYPEWKVEMDFGTRVCLLTHQ